MEFELKQSHIDHMLLMLKKEAYTELAQSENISIYHENIVGNSNTQYRLIIEYGNTL